MRLRESETSTKLYRYANMDAKSGVRNHLSRQQQVRSSKDQMNNSKKNAIIYIRDPNNKNGAIQHVIISRLIKFIHSKENHF